MVASACLLALFGHDPDNAGVDARVGSLLVVEFLALVRALVRGMSESPKGRAPRG
jgi:hypothetical protein